MNLSKFTMAALCATMLTGFTAQAEDNQFYLQLNGGAALGLAPKGDFGTKKAGNSGLIGVEAGYQFDEHLRTSVSLDYLTNFSFTETANEVKSSNRKSTADVNYKVKSLLAMVNFYYDIMEAKGFTPYVTVGAGIARNKTTSSGTWSAVSGNATGNGAINFKNYTKNNFAWKVGLGTRYAVNQNVALDLRYQYADLGKIATGTGTQSLGKKSADLNVKKGKLRAHEFLLGVAYTF